MEREGPPPSYFFTSRILTILVIICNNPDKSQPDCDESALSRDGDADDGLLLWGNWREIKGLGRRIWEEVIRERAK